MAASGGYPEKYGKGYEISGIDKAEASGAMVFHAGTAIDGDKLVTAGGRVLGVTATAADLDTAITKAYDAVAAVSFKHIHYRRDIGCK